MEKIKIALFHNNSTGGTERALYEFIKYFSKKSEYKIDIYTVSEISPRLEQYGAFQYIKSGIFKETSKFNSPFGRFNPILSLMDLCRLNRASKEIAKKINEGGYKLAFINLCKYTYAPLILRHIKIPKIYYSHDLMNSARKRGKACVKTFLAGKSAYIDKIDILKKYRDYYYRKIDAYNIKKADLVLTNSEFMKKMIYEDYGVNSLVNYLGVDPDIFKPKNESKENIVISVGHLLSHKAHDFVIKALAYIPEEKRPLLIIAGSMIDPTQKQYLEKLADEKKVKISIISTTCDDKLVEIYNRAKITAIASINEPFGFVPIESMACGTPVVAVDEGGFKETVKNGKTGYLVKRDPVFFGDRVRYLLENESVREEFSREGRTYILANWTWEKSFKELNIHFMKLIEEKENSDTISRVSLSKR